MVAGPEGDDRSYSPVFDSRGARIQGVYRRAGSFFARVLDPVSGRRLWRLSPDGTVEGARRLVKLSRRTLAGARAARFAEALDGLRSHRTGWSVADVLRAYPAAAADRRAATGKPGEEFATGVVSTLRRVFNGHLDAPIAKAPDLLHAWCVAWNAERGGGRPTVTAATVSRFVHAAFAPWAMEAYAEQGCQDGAPRWRRIVAPAFRYELPPLELRERTIEAGKRELAAGSEIGRAFLLQFFCAMSAQDAIRAQWDWIAPDGAVRYSRHKTGKPCCPKLAPSVAQRWRELAAAPDAGAFVLPGRTERARFDLLQVRLSRWMRGLGWTSRKCGHELRKLMCSIWYTTPGIGAAWTQEFSGDSLQVLQQFYARLLPEVAPATPEV
jgi:hypothetical protein